MPVARQSVDKCGEYVGKLRIFRWRSAQQFQLLAFGCQRLSVEYCDPQSASWRVAPHVAQCRQGSRIQRRHEDHSNNPE